MMNTKLQSLINDAEDHYLPSPELNQFTQDLAMLPGRVATYEVLRDREVEVFQAVADDLQAAFASLPNDLINRALQGGLAVMRYGAMAMLTGNRDYFEQHLLANLAEQVNAYELEAVMGQLFDLLQDQLNRRIESSQVSLIRPYLEQARQTIVPAPQAMPEMAMA